MATGTVRLHRVLQAPAEQASMYSPQVRPHSALRDARRTIPPRRSTQGLKPTVLPCRTQIGGREWESNPPGSD
jgi:hypothetical protein